MFTDLEKQISHTQRANADLIPQGWFPLLLKQPPAFKGNCATVPTMKGILIWEAMRMRF